MTEPMTPSDFLDLLEARGLIERTARTHPRPGMVYPFTRDMIRITEAGRRLIEDPPPGPDPS